MFIILYLLKCTRIQSTKAFPLTYISFQVTTGESLSNFYHKYHRLIASDSSIFLEEQFWLWPITVLVQVQNPLQVI
jgi:hypothetical protein